MKNYKYLLKDFAFWFIIYTFIVTIALVWVSVSYYNHKCPDPILPEITKENKIIINKIDNATTKSDRDSLMLLLYGFESK